MSSAQFQIVSDLHLETHPSYDGFRLRKTAEYLALLGDIGHVGDDRFLSFLEKQVQRYWAVFFLLGNHEPYHLDFPAAKSRMRAFADRMEAKRRTSTIGRFIFLDQTRYDMPGYRLTILGCTLFSHITKEQAASVASRLVDFKDIVDWTIEQHNLAHQSDLEWLNAEVAKIAREQPTRNIAIFTHHSPCSAKEATRPKHRNSEVSSGFVTNLEREECWMNPRVKMWAFGHTHFNCDFEDKVDGETGIETSTETSTGTRTKRVVANQKGYYLLPERDFNGGKLFEVGE